jgi:hypothetical protein
MDGDAGQGPSRVSMWKVSWLILWLRHDTNPVIVQFLSTACRTQKDSCRYHYPFPDLRRTSL